jgi:hypothetical protein
MMTIDDPTSGKTQGGSFRVILVLVVAAFFVIAVHQHLFNVNSHYYYTWKWQWIPSIKLYPTMLPLAIPFFAGQMLYLRRPQLVWLALALCMISMFGLMVVGAALQNDPPSFTRISDVVRSRWTTGFFAQAVALRKSGMSVRQFLARYPELLQHFYIHPRQKPPGPILIELVIIRIFGPGEGGAMASGLLIGLGGTISVLATYAFIKFLTESRDAAFFGASYFALSPSPVLFFPQFDQCYPILTAGIVICAVLTLRKNQIRYSVALGLTYAATVFITPLPGVLVFFLVGFAVLKYLTDPKCGAQTLFKHFVISLGTSAVCYLILWLITGFDPIATLRECARQVNVIWDTLYTVYGLPRHHLPETIPADLYDFALGSGWISYVLVICYFMSACKNKGTVEFWIALLCVAQFVVIALIGLLQTEASRVWLFMYPMLMLPVGLELARWQPWQRLAVYAALLLLTAAMCQSMQFIGAAM